VKTVIEKRVWKPFFEDLITDKKNFDIRLADFELKEGDEVLFREYDQGKREYTGREILAQVKNLHLIKLTNFYPIEKIEECGCEFWAFEWTEVKGDI